VIAANRDEYYDRPTAPAEFWKETPDLLGGRDIRAGGTWLGITRKGRIAAITNFRDPSSNHAHAPSRGGLVTQFLTGGNSPAEFVAGLVEEGVPYNGYNLILGAGEELLWYSNRGKGPLGLTPGFYGLSNHLLDTSWPKVAWGKKTFAALLSQPAGDPIEPLFRMLGNRKTAPDENLPDTGVGLEWERILSPVFITSPTYGTRSSTILLIDGEDHATFLERTYPPENPDQHETRHYAFTIGR
jgi:uncharacterized protein with NRDE domain